MGSSYSVTCGNCKHNFSVREGGGFIFHLLKCDACGRDRRVRFDELGELHLRYVKGLSGPYSIATSENDRRIQEEFPGEPVTETEYHQLVEKTLDPCGCGGSFKFDAPARCPKCRGTDLDVDPDGPAVLYD